jgi:hypothetical protein
MASNRAFGSWINIASLVVEISASCYGVSTIALSTPTALKLGVALDFRFIRIVSAAE